MAGGVKAAGRRGGCEVQQQGSWMLGGMKLQASELDASSSCSSHAAHAFTSTLLNLLDPHLYVIQLLQQLFSKLVHNQLRVAAQAAQAPAALGQAAWLPKAHVYRGPSGCRGAGSCVNCTKAWHAQGTCPAPETV